jgi:catechol 2,3-dioxygenase-like lactoylglutathione lyase family enzyme
MRMPPERFAHVGLTVSNLDQMVGLFTGMLGFELSGRLRPFDPHAVAGITGVAEAVVEEIAYLRRGDLAFELLQYRDPPPRSSTLRPCDPGYMHWLLEVDSLADSIERAAAFGFARVSAPYRITAGPNAGKYGTYLRHPDGFALELIGPSSAQGMDLPSATSASP